MNYIDYFAKGGKTRRTKTQKYSQSEQDNAIMSVLKEALGVKTDEEVIQMYQAAAGNNPEEFDAQLSSILESASSKEEAYAAIQELFTPKANSVFKCGGKMQRLSQRFARGGAADCGCKKKIQSADEGTRLLRNANENASGTRNVKTSNRTDVNEVTTTGSKRRGTATSWEDEQGNKYYRLTRGEAGQTSNQDGTYFPGETSTVVQLPDGSWRGMYEQDHRDKWFNRERQFYAGPSSARDFRLTHPFWGLNRRKTTAIPQSWIDAFNRNFGITIQ